MITIEACQMWAIVNRTSWKDGRGANFSSWCSPAIIMCGFHACNFSQQQGCACGWRVAGAAVVQAWDFWTSRDKLGQCRSLKHGKSRSLLKQILDVFPQSHTACQWPSQLLIPGFLTKVGSSSPAWCFLLFWDNSAQFPMTPMLGQPQPWRGNDREVALQVPGPPQADPQPAKVAFKAKS